MRLEVTLRLLSLCRLRRVFVCVHRHHLHRDGQPGHGAVDAGRPHLVRLHVLLHIRLLGKSTAAHDALEGLLTCVTEAQPSLQPQL